jgi:hypothetical protein
LWLSAVAVLVVWSPELSQACSVCSAGREDENRLAFILTTAFLTFLPLSMIGGFVWYLRRRYLQLELELELEPELELELEAGAERSAPVVAAGAGR